MGSRRSVAACERTCVDAAFSYDEPLGELSVGNGGVPSIACAEDAGGGAGRGMMGTPRTATDARAHAEQEPWVCVSDQVAALAPFNTLFQFSDLRAIFRQRHARGLRRCVEALTRARCATTSHGRLDMTNLNDATRFRLHTVYYGRLWEYVRLVTIANVQPGMRVLDCGGASSPLVFYLGQLGCETVCADIAGPLVKNTEHVAARMGWPISARQMDMRALDFPDETFDTVVSSSVIEHLGDENKRLAVSEMARVLKPGGVLGLSFDYGPGERYGANPSGEGHVCVHSVAHLEEVFVPPSRCELVGNERFVVPDPLEYPVYPRPRFRGRRYGWLYGAFLRDPNRADPEYFYRIDRTLGTIFLTKRARGLRQRSTVTPRAKDLP